MNIISFSLYGDNPLYTEGALVNLEYSKTIYPDWKCRFYCDRNSVPMNIIHALQQGDAEVVMLEDSCHVFSYAPSIWRMRPFMDSSCSYFIVRDADSRLSFREKAAVDEWIASKKTLHLLHDHNAHTSPVMGGLFGAKGNSLPDFARILNEYMNTDTYQRFGLDQRFLNRVVLPLFSDDYFSHNDRLEQHDSTLSHTKFPVVKQKFLATDQLFLGQTISVENAKPKPHRM
jgi:hypothetical protein